MKRELRFFPSIALTLLACMFATSLPAMTLVNLSAPNYALEPVTLGVSNVSAPNNVWTETDCLGQPYETGSRGVYAFTVRARSLATGQWLESREFDGSSVSLSYDVPLPSGNYEFHVNADALDFTDAHAIEEGYYDEDGNWQFTGYGSGGGNRSSGGGCDAALIYVTVSAGGGTPQTISWILPPPANWPWNQTAPVTVAAVSSSGLPVRFSMVPNGWYSGLFSVSGNQISYSGSTYPISVPQANFFELRAEVGGNATYDYAESVVSFVVARATQNLSLKIPNQSSATAGTLSLASFLTGHMTTPSFSGSATWGQITGSYFTTLSYPAGVFGTTHIVARCEDALFAVATAECQFQIGPPTAPTINVQPSNQTRFAGQPVTFRADVTGIPSPTTLQWRKNGIDVTAGSATHRLLGNGTTAAELTLTNPQFADSGSYTVVVTNSAGSVTSGPAILTINPPPSPSAPAITTQPANVGAAVGGSVTLAVVATGWPTPAYQWRKGTLELPGATNASYTLPNLQLGHAGTYTVTATNIHGAVTSNPATVSVAPTLTAPAAAVTTVLGWNVTLAPAVAGSPTPTFTWKKNGNTIAGANGATLAFTNVTAADAATYTFAATNSAGTLTGSIPLTVLTSAAPVITAVPASPVPAVLGGSLNLTAAAQGMPPLTYRWKKNGVPLNDGSRLFGATMTTLMMIELQAEDTAFYQFEVTNAHGSALSGSIFLMVQGGVAPSITSHPADQTVAVGGAITLSVAASGIPAPSFQWRKNGQNIGNSGPVSGATTATLTISDAMTTDAGSYSVLVSNTVGFVASQSAIVAVSDGGSSNVAPTIVSQPASAAVAFGSSYDMGVTATGSGQLNYEWRRDGIPLAEGNGITGVSTQTLTFSAFQPVQSGSYDVKVSNSFGIVTSNAATITVASASGGANGSSPGAANRSPTVPGVVSTIVGGSGYDIQSGAIVRAVADFTVTGSVGAYPLEMRRGYSAKQGWSHSFVAYAEENVDSLWPGSPSVQNLNVSLPDGQFLNFNVNDGGVLSEFFQTNDGVRVNITRDEVHNSPTYMRVTGVTLSFPDGGTMTLAHCDSGSSSGPGSGTSWRNFRPIFLVDPFGQATNFSYANGTTTLPEYVRDSSDRWLKFTGNSPTAITRIESSCGKWIEWSRNYEPGKDKVTYWDNWVAYYESGNLSGGQVYRRFSDVRQASAMQKVEYVLAPVGYNQWGSTALGDSTVFEVVSERYPHPGSAAGQGTVVSTRAVRARQMAIEGVGLVAAGPAIDVTETRGDGPSRRFTFGGPPTYKPTSAANFRGYVTNYLDWSGNFPGRIVDARGHTTTITSTAPGQIERIQHHDGSFRQFEWNGKYLVGERDERGNWTYFDRDSAMRIWRIRYPDAAYETFGYNAKNQIVAHRLRNGAFEFHKFNARWLREKHWTPTTAITEPTPVAAGYLDDILDAAALATLADKPMVQFAYYPDGHPSEDRVQTAADPRGHATDYEYNADGRVTKETFPLTDGSAGRAFRSFVFDTWGNRLSVTNERGKSIDYTYDEYSRLTSVTDANDSTTLHSYVPAPGVSEFSRTAAAITESTSPENRRTTYAYNADLLRTEVVRRAGTAAAAKTTTDYDAVGNVSSVTAEVTASTSRTTTYTHDSRNRRTHQHAPLGRTTEWRFDAAGNVEKIIYPHVPVDPIAPQPNAGEAANTVSRTFDAMNRVLTETNELAHTTTYTYHPSGRVHEIFDPRHTAATPHKYVHAYNTRDQLRERTYPLGTGEAAATKETWDYDAAGNPKEYLNRSSQKQEFEFDARNREKRRWWTGEVAPEVNTAYFDDGTVRQRTNATSTLDYTYHPDGALWTETQTVAGAPSAVTLTYTYHADGQRATLASSTGQSLSYQYDDRGLPWKVLSGTTVLATYTYNRADERLLRTSANTIVADHGYDAAGRLDSLKLYYFADTAENARLALGFGWSPRDRRKWTLRNGQTGDTYEYFDDGQLQRYRHEVSRPDTEVNFGNAAGWTDTFAYDAAGNRTALNENGNATTYTPDPLNRYTAVSGPAGGAIGHDARGNVSQFQDWTYTHDAENRLTAASKTGESIAFAHDPAGRLAKVTRNGTVEYRAYDGVQCFLRRTAAGTVLDWTVWGPAHDEVVARQKDGAWQYYHADQLSSVFAVTDAAGTVLERYLYDPFGEPGIRAPDWSARTASTIGNPWLFTGQEWRAEMGLANYKARWHHPRLGRFLENDPVRFDAGDLNLYRYCFNDPVNHSDPLGTQPTSLSDEWRVVYRNPDAAPNSAPNLGDTKIIQAGIQVNTRGLGPGNQFDKGTAAAIDFVASLEHPLSPIGFMGGVANPAGELYDKIDAAKLVFDTVRTNPAGKGGDAAEAAGNLLTQARKLFNSQGPFEGHTIIQTSTYKAESFLIFFTRNQWVPNEPVITQVKGPLLMGTFPSPASAGSAASAALKGQLQKMNGKRGGGG